MPPLPLIDLKTFSASRTLMVQGCTSDAGKSILVAGLCRWLSNKKQKVAPFKPQNMALNSAVTEDGGEIGRAQALQALAARVQPRIDFNPILLKPSSDTAAQVIVHGKALSSMQAAAYHDYKKIAMQAVLGSHSRLIKDYQWIAVEGAGSPAEINLREGDVANMGFAEKVDCPVILIADIDKGGVFAHLVGTLELLSPSERKRVVGFVINKFRGDIELLKPGLDWLEERTKIPVLGVLPYLKNFYVEAEDAISTAQNKESSTFKIIVPVFSRISNHTDFDALRLHPQVDLEFVSLDSKDRRADLIVMSGSKNVIADLSEFEQHGWKETIKRHLRLGGKLMGICGGYQMLGQLIDDPNGIENNGVSISKQGLGLLPIKTHLKSNKVLHNLTATMIGPGLTQAEVAGYEIHCGVSVTTSTASHAAPFLRLNDGRHDGLVSQCGQVLGTYLHGIFDQSEATQSILSWAGLRSDEAIDWKVEQDQQLDRLAECLDRHLRADFLNNMVAGD